MKTLLVLLIGAALGILGYQYYQKNHSSVSRSASDAADTTRDKAAELKDTVAQKSHQVGEKLDDARIITAIKGKYVIDKELSALAISVACHDGNVTLAGTVESDALVVKAMRIANDTSGVRNVESKISVQR